MRGSLLPTGLMNVFTIGSITWVNCSPWLDSGKRHSSDASGTVRPTVPVNCWPVVGRVNLFT
jgi:hypothetical protein